MPNINRRRFITGTSAVVAGALLFSCWNPRSSHRFRVAIIGAGGFGSHHIREYLKRRDCHIAYICDADESVGRKRAEEVFQKAGYRPTVVQDMRRIFDDPTVEVVSIATPDHWHALASIWAMQSGKDVYLEKPGSHSLEQIPLLMQAAKKYARVCQIGLHQRSNQGLQQAIQYLQEGNLGEVRLAKSLAYVRRKPIGEAGNFAPPSSVDYDLWCGPAPHSPILRKKFHYDWHWFWDYGTGGIGNNGIHRVDIARWGLGLEGVGVDTTSFGGRLGPQDAGETPNTQIAIHDFGSKTILQEIRGLRSGPYHHCKNGVIFQGSTGYLVCEKHKSTHYDPRGKTVKKFGDSPSFLSDHIQNFLDCVLSRKMENLAANLAKVADSARLCHLANLSYRLGEAVSQQNIPSRASSLNIPDDVVERTLQHLALQAPGQELIWGKTLAGVEHILPAGGESAGPFKMPTATEI